MEGPDTRLSAHISERGDAMSTSPQLEGQESLLGATGEAELQAHERVLAPTGVLLPRPGSPGPKGDSEQVVGKCGRVGVAVLVLIVLASAITNVYLLATVASSSGKTMLTVATDTATA